MFSDWSSHQKERSILIGWSLNRLSHTPASAPWQSEVRNKKRQEATECWENMGVGELSHEGTSTRTDYSLGWHSKGRVCQYLLGLAHLHFPQFCYGCDIPGLAFLVTPFNWMMLFPRRWSVISSSSVTLCSLHSYLLLSPYHWQAHNQIGIRCVTGLGTIYHRAMEKEHNKALWGHSSSALSNHHSTFPPLIEGYSVFSLSKNTCNLHFYLRPYFTYDLIQ